MQSKQQLVKKQPQQKRQGQQNQRRRNGNNNRRNIPVNLSYQNKIDFKSCIIKHKELVGQVQGGSFSQFTIKVQPGNKLSFPWLSSIATNFEYYEIINMNYEFVSNLPTTSKGIAYMAIDYNAADIPLVATEQDISQYSGVQTFKCFMNNKLHIQRNKLGKQKFRIKTEGGYQNNTAIQDYDAGSFMAVVASNSDTGNIANIYVNYEIKLSVPQPNITSPNESSAVVARTTFPAENISNVYETLNEGTVQLGRDIEFKDGVFTFLKDGEYQFDLNVQTSADSPAIETQIDYLSVYDTFGTLTATVKNWLNESQPLKGLYDIGLGGSIGVLTAYITAKAGQKFGLPQGAAASVIGGQNIILVEAIMNRIFPIIL